MIATSSSDMPSMGSSPLRVSSLVLGTVDQVLSTCVRRRSRVPGREEAPKQRRGAVQGHSGKRHDRLAQAVRKLVREFDITRRPLRRTGRVLLGTHDDLVVPVGPGAAGAELYLDARLAGQQPLAPLVQFD